MSRRICVICGRELGVGPCPCWLELIDVEDSPVWETGIKRQQEYEDESNDERPPTLD